MNTPNKNAPAPPASKPAAQAPTKEAKKLTPEQAKAEKADRFKRVAGYRVNQIVKSLSLIGNCSNRLTYDYSNEQVEKLFGSIEKALTIAKSKYAEKAKDVKPEKIEL